MDIQLKKGILEGCVLHVIEKEVSYGYKIIQDVSRFIPISESTLYPILKRLCATNCVEVFSAEHNGRLRKYYQINDGGRERLREFYSDLSEIVAVSTLLNNRNENGGIK